MDHFLDQAARILASELPRRQALKRLGGLVAGGLLATLGVKSVEAQGCPPGKPATSCPGNPSPNPAFCVTSPKCACGTKKCNPTETCCPGNGNPFCATKGKPQCCGTKSCKTTDTCCPGNGFPFCATKGKPQCCGTSSCKTDESCCGSKCCKSGEACSDGKCVASPAKK